MKKLTFLLFAAFSSLTASAQTEKGSQWIGGSLSASHDDRKIVYSTSNPQPNSTRKTSTFNIGPSYSYFLADNLGITASLSYSNSHEDASDEFVLETDYKAVFGSLALNKYALYDNKIGVRFGPFARYTSGKNRMYNSRPDDFRANTKQRALTTGLNLDFVYFPVKRIGMVAGIGSLNYEHIGYEDTGMEFKQNSFSFDIMSSTNFSLYYSF